MQDKKNQPTASTEERALPSSDRLLRGIQATLQKIVPRVGDEQSQAELSAIDTVLSELARREQIAFYRDFYQAVRALLADGLALPDIGAETLATIAGELGATLPPQLDERCGYEVATRDINRVMRHLATLVNAVHGRTAPAVEDFLQRVVARENEFHVHRAQFAQKRVWNTADEAPPISAERLQDYLRQRFPERPGLRVTHFKQLVGGFQKVTILFETEDASGREESLVLRAEKNDRFVALDASDIRKEYEIIEFLHAEGMPVATPLWIESDEAKLGNRFFVSQKVPGENYGTAVSAKGITDDIARSYMEGIARVHRIPVSAAMRRLAIGHWLDFATAQDNGRAAINYWRHQPWMKTASPSPLTERLTHWLIDNVPQGDIPQCLIHCDYGPHNTLVHNGRLSGILDWESARIGDPAEDVSWFLQSCGGQVDYGKAIAWYEEFTGHRISEYRLRYFDLMGCLKIMVSSGSAEAMYEAHDDASIVWLTLPYRFTSYGSSTVEGRIKLAESLKGQ